MNENEIYVVKEYKFADPVFHKIDSIIYNCYRDCLNKYFHTFKYVFIYDIELTNITNNEIINITISDESMNLFELNKKLTFAQGNGFIVSRMNKLTIKIYSYLSHLNIRYQLKLGSPPLHSQFFRRISKNRDYIQTHCNDRRNPFHFACRPWYSYNNPGILT